VSAGRWRRWSLYRVVLCILEFTPLLICDKITKCSLSTVSVFHKFDQYNLERWIRDDILGFRSQTSLNGWSISFYGTSLYKAISSCTPSSIRREVQQPLFFVWKLWGTWMELEATARDHFVTFKWTMKIRWNGLVRSVLKTISTTSSIISFKFECSVGASKSCQRELSSHQFARFRWQLTSNEKVIKKMSLIIYK